MELHLDPALAAKLKRLYEDMARAYEVIAGELGHSCDGCPDNCCDSYFLHHTYIEWAYLWLGVGSLPADIRDALLARAREYVLMSEKEIGGGGRPKLMCPLNEDGRCSLYAHRLMVCRTHGVPASMTRPDGKKLNFPGCFRCQGLVEGKGLKEQEIPVMERTELLRRLVALEQEFLAGRRHLAPKVKRTIAQMLVSGPPALPHCSDKKS